MLITELKSKEELSALGGEKLFVVLCAGCRELYFPEQEAEELLRTLTEQKRLSGVLRTDYLCHPEYLASRLERCREALEAAEAVLVLSCGVGVQTVAEYLEGKKVYAGCNTLALPGFSGLTPTEVDCGRCGECRLSQTGGICPVTACSKGLLNGPCGGSRNGRCEVDPEMECGWERILRRLGREGLEVARSNPALFRDYAVMSGTDEMSGD